jgi:tetratricopeptide (TPR) repeat protein
MLLVAACASAPRQTAATTPFEAISFRGDTLRATPLSAETRARYERQLAEARAAYERAPNDADSIVWLGRRLAYLGRFRDAIDVYSRGIALHPDNPWLYRHRGHRYISTRQLDRAIADLDRAAQLVAGKPDQVEPDGQPNAQNLPIGTLHSNIDYHLALAHYLKGDYTRALPIYRRELANARNDDRRVSIAYWNYLALRKLGRDAEAAAVLAPIDASLRVIENDAYKNMLLMFKGEIGPDSLLRSAPDRASTQYATLGYGVASWYLLTGRREDGVRLLREIVASGNWPAFGFIAAEADLSRF